MFDLHKSRDQNITIKWMQSIQKLLHTKANALAYIDCSKYTGHKRFYITRVNNRHTQSQRNHKTQVIKTGSRGRSYRIYLQASPTPQREWLTWPLVVLLSTCVTGCGHRMYGRRGLEGMNSPIIQLFPAPPRGVSPACVGDICLVKGPRSLKGILYHDRVNLQVQVASISRSSGDTRPSDSHSH